MKKYKDRFICGFSKAVSVVYLTTAILWGSSCCVFSLDRAQVRNDFEDGKMSHEEYVLECHEIGEREENVLKTIAITFGLAFVADIVLGVVENERE